MLELVRECRVASDTSEAEAYPDRLLLAAIDFEPLRPSSRVTRRQPPDGPQSESGEGLLAAVALTG